MVAMNIEMNAKKNKSPSQAMKLNSSPLKTFSTSFLRHIIFLNILPVFETELFFILNGRNNYFLLCVQGLFRKFLTMIFTDQTNQVSVVGISDLCEQT